MKTLICEDGLWFLDINPRDIECKTAKSRYAIFLPLPDDILQNVLDWREYLISQGFKNKDPFFPIIPKHFNQDNMLEGRLKNEAIKSNTTLRDIFKKAFEAAGYEYLRPHSFRHTIVRFAEHQSPHFMNAIRQSLGHKSVDTSFCSYGELSDYEQRTAIGESKVGFE
jgi:integrase